MTHPSCYLTVLKRLTKEQIDELVPLLGKMNPDDMDVMGALEESSVICFNSIFEGDISMDTLRWFSQQKVSFTWEWEAYDSVGAGCNFYDADIDHVHHIRMHENLAVLSLTEAADPVKVENLSSVIVSLNMKRFDMGITKKPF